MHQRKRGRLVIGLNLECLFKFFPCDSGLAVLLPSQPDFHMQIGLRRSGCSKVTPEISRFIPTRLLLKQLCSSLEQTGMLAVHQ